MIKIIAAVAANGVIGRGLEVPPWHLPDDMGWFKTQTGNCAVVMGRKTFHSLPEQFKPLPGRENIVLTRDKWNAISEHENLRFLHDFDEIMEVAEKQDIFVIGGAQIYQALLPYADELYLTSVHGSPEGDVFFPEWNPNEWVQVFKQNHPKDERHEFPFTWEIYSRRHAPILKSHPFIEMSNVRTDKQRQVMEQILEAGHCPFCLENLERWHKPVILREGRHWIVTYNQWRYPNTELHLLIISREHAEDISDLPSGAVAELFDLTKWAKSKFGIQGGALAMRFGEPTLTGATVRHLHAQIVVPHPKAIGPALIYVGGSKADK